MPKRTVLNRWSCGVLAALTLLVFAASAASSETNEVDGPLQAYERLVGNLGVVSAEVGVYPDFGATPVVKPTSATFDIAVPDGAVVESALLTWSGRGPTFDDDEVLLDTGSGPVAVGAEDEFYNETQPGWSQHTYFAELGGREGLTFTPGATTSVSVGGLDHGGDPLDRLYGIGLLIVYSSPAEPEVELVLLRGNDFAFQRPPDDLDTYSDPQGRAGSHSEVACSPFGASGQAREVSLQVRVVGIDAGQSGAPRRTQRLQWWSRTGALDAPVGAADNGAEVTELVTIEASGSVVNPVDPKEGDGLDDDGHWGIETVEQKMLLGAGDTHLCTQLQSLTLDSANGDAVFANGYENTAADANASLSQVHWGAAAPAIYRIGNLVWRDDDADGIADLGEPGIAGVTVELWRPGADAPVASTSTDEDGRYSFEGLTGGSYTVQMAADQTGQRIDGAGIDLADLTSSSVEVADADGDIDNDDNGIADGDRLVSGLVQLGDDGSDGDFADDASNEPTDEVTRSGGTDDDEDELDAAAGNYDDVRSNYSVDFGFVPPRYDLALVKVLSDYDPADRHATFTIRVRNQGDVASGALAVTDTPAPGTSFVSASDGGVETPAGSGIVVWKRSGAQELQPGESVDFRVTVRLDDLSAAPFVNNAEISEDSGDDIDSHPDASQVGALKDPAVDRITLDDDGEIFGDEDDHDIANVALFEVGDLLFVDADNSGARDAGEPALGAGIIVRLLDPDGTILDSTTTNAEGRYLFSGLLAADYVVEVAGSNFAEGGPLAGYMPSTGPAVATDPDDDIDSNSDGISAGGGVRSSSVTIGGGEPTDEDVESPTGTGDTESNLSVDFGFFLKAGLGDFVWFDDGDDVQGGAEDRPAAGVTVELVVCGSDTPLATTVTDSQGRYSFLDLLPGTYQVRFETPDGYRLVERDAGSDDAADSDADSPTGCSHVTTLESGDLDLTLDAGLRQVGATLPVTVTPPGTVGGLPDTGADAGLPIDIALWVMALGGGLLLVSERARIAAGASPVGNNTTLTAMSEERTDAWFHRTNSPDPDHRHRGGHPGLD